MENQDHKTAAAASAGHEGYGVHTCHRCGWPFPNPHPSAKHRRAHKKVCGSIEGYKIIISEEEDSHLAVSVEGHASDEDAHSPSPASTPVKERSSGLSGSIGVGEKSNKSEDDVFCDAATEFSDGGKGKQLESQFDSVIGKEVNAEQKAVEVPTNIGELPNHGALENANYGSKNVMFHIDKADTVNEETLLGFRDSVRPNPINEDMFPFKDAESENKTSDLSFMAVEGNTDISDKLTFHMVEHAVSPEADTPKDMDTCVKKQNLANFSGLTDSAGIPAGNILSKGSNQIDDVSMVKKVSDSAVVENDSVKLSEEECIVSSHAKDDMGKMHLNKGDNVDNSDSSAVDKHDSDRNENGNLEFVDKLPNETVLAAELRGDSFSTKNDQAVEKSSNGGGKSAELSEAGNQIGSDSSVEVPKEVDYSMPFLSSNPSPSLPETVTYAIILDEEAKTDLNRLEPKDNVHLKAFTDKETEMQPVDSAILEHDAVDTGCKSPPSATSEDSALPAISELTKSNATSNGVRAASVSDGGMVSGKVAISDETLEQHASPIDAAEARNEPNLDKSIVGKCVPSKQKCESERVTDTNGHRSEVVNAEILVVPVGNISSEDRAPTPSTFQDSQETPAKSVDEGTNDIEHDGGVMSKPLQDKNDEKGTEQKNGASAKELSVALSSRCDSLEANYGSISAVSQSSDALEANSEKQKETDKSEVFEPPSFMTLVQPDPKPNQETDTISEIGTLQQNQSNSLQAGWFPLLTNIVNESEGRKKNEEMIAKVTNWSPVKQKHSPLKTLLSEVKSPNAKQVLSSNEKQETEVRDKGAVSTTEAKNMEEWNSPARYAIEAKEKKKRRPYWVPFVCCFSVHGDL